MEKKKRSKKAAEPKAKPEKVHVEKPAKKLEEKMALVDYCRLHVEGYKEHWFKSIEKHASNHGAKTEELTASECRQLLLTWGAKLK